MWFCPFLTFSLLLAQRSVLVGLGFFGSHRAIYLHWRNLRAESHDAASRPCENHPMISVCPRASIVSLSCKLHPVLKKSWSARGEFLITAPSLETMTLTCHHYHQPAVLDAHWQPHMLCHQNQTLVSEDAALRAEFGSSYLGLHMHLAVSSSPPASWDSITPLCSKSSQRTEGAKI